MIPGPRYRIVVSVHDPPMWTMPATVVERLACALPDDVVVDARTPEARLEAIAGADIFFSTRITPDEFAQARRLRWINTSAVGVGGLLHPDVVRSPVVVTNARGLHADAIAEHAIALVLALRRGLHVAAARQAAGEWAQIELSARRVMPLVRTRLLVVGLGAIGTRVAALAAGLGMSVSGIRRDPSKGAPAGVRTVGGPGDLRHFLRNADVVVLAAPSAAGGDVRLGREELSLLPASAILINVARGKLVDEDALDEALRTGRLAGAGIDAFPREPLPPDSPWWRRPNLIATPHSAAFDGDYWTPVAELFLRNLERFDRQQPLENVVDKERGY